MSKSNVVLNETNFNRIKKNLAKQLNLPQNVIAESMSKSIGFSNLHQAQNEGFKTNKFQLQKQSKFPNLKEISKRAKVLKDKASNLLLFNYQEKTNFLKEVNSFIYEDLLKTEDLIIADLKNCLRLELDFGVEFDLEAWLKEIHEQGLFNEIFISVNIESFFEKILKDLKENNEIKMIDLIEEDLVLLCLKKENEVYLKMWWESLNFDLLIKEIDKIRVSNDISEICHALLNIGFDFISIEPKKTDKKQKTLAVNYYAARYILYKNERLILSEKTKNMILDKTMKILSEELLDFQFVLLSIIIQVLKEEDQVCFKKDLYEKLKSERGYLFKIDAVKSFFDL